MVHSLPGDRAETERVGAAETATAPIKSRILESMVSIELCVLNWTYQRKLVWQTLLILSKGGDEMNRMICRRAARLFIPKFPSMILNVN